MEDIGTAAGISGALITQAILAIVHDLARIQHLDDDLAALGQAVLTSPRPATP